MRGSFASVRASRGRRVAAWTAVGRWRAILPKAFSTVKRDERYSPGNSRVRLERRSLRSCVSRACTLVRASHSAVHATLGAAARLPSGPARLRGVGLAVACFPWASQPEPSSDLRLRGQSDWWLAVRKGPAPAEPRRRQRARAAARRARVRQYRRQPRALLDKYCVTCHNDRLKTANLSLQGLDLTQGRRSRRAVGEGDPQAARGCDAAAQICRGRRWPSTTGLRDWLEAEIDRGGGDEAEPGLGRPSSAESDRVRQRHSRSARPAHRRHDAAAAR